MPADDIVGLPNEIKNNKTLKSRKKFNLSTRPFKTHLNILFINIVYHFLVGKWLEFFTVKF